jgi:hypothetical protein
MLRFQVGEKVILAHKNTSRRLFGIPSKHWGKEFVILRVYEGEGNSYELPRPGGATWYVYEDMLEPAKPLTPFERRVRRYIDKELRNA